MTTIHGLTPEQLEAIRGYCETTAAILSARDELAAGHEPSIAAIVRRNVAARMRHTEALSREATPFSDGVRAAIEATGGALAQVKAACGVEVSDG